MKPRTIHAALLALAACVCALRSSAAAATTEDFTAALGAIAAARSYAEKEVAARALAATGDDRAAAVLAAFLEGRLYTTRAGDRVVIADETAGGFAIRDAATEEALGVVGRREVTRIGVNNALRSALREILAGLRLYHEDPQERIAAVTELGRAGDPAALPALEGLLATETHRGVIRAVRTAMATLNLQSTDRDTLLAAIDAVAGSMDGAVRNGLTRVAGDAALDEDVRAAARAALESIERRAELYELVKTVFFGLSLGSILVLVAIGLSVTFGIMGVINMAHGELMMLGAYTAYVVQTALPELVDWSLLIAVPAAFLVAGAFGVAIERGIVRFLYGRPLETLLATFGVSLLLQQTVRTVFSPLNRSVATPSWMSGSWTIVPGLEITYNRLYILLFSLAVFLLLLVALKRTRLGLEMRAVTQNRAMARALGVRTDRIDALTFGLGAGIAGVAGVALSQLTNVGPNLGQSYIVDSFMVVVFGGVGNLWGTLVGGLTLGVANKVLEPMAGAVMAKILVLVFLIVFIQKRPRGLFPQKGRAAEG
ncbi:MAG TPA: urea ABC transporter permease subunit UrtB [Gammaproteobacteria bacterium]